MIFILRNNNQFGPYEPLILKAYIEEGKILLCDKAFHQQDPTLIKTARYFIEKEGIKVKLKHKGDIITQLKDIGSELILPKDIFSKKAFNEKRLIWLSVIGLSPAILIRFTLIPFLTYYSIALYFSLIWGLFFYYFYKTNQVNSKTTIISFFFVQFLVFFGWDILKISEWPIISFFYSLTTKDIFLYKVIGFIFGVGILEEFVKAIPLIFLIRKANEPYVPQTIVFYGLMSGIAFGVYEGVHYQMSLNKELDYDFAFFMNIARLTSLPFLHAIWSGIAGYFLAFSNLYPKYRLSLFSLAIGIPAIIHGLYDVLGWSILGLLLTFVSVVLLNSYLKMGINYQSKLSK